jgi:hypothetical protein
MKSGWCIVILIATITLMGVLIHSPAISSDPGWGLIAAEQFNNGKSHSPIYLNEADFLDLSRDKEGKNTWWAPSYQLVPYFFRMLGFSWGSSLKIVFLLFWSLGFIAWGKYFQMVLNPPSLLPWFLAAFLLFRYTHIDSHIYTGGEFLLWGMAPWIILLNLRFMELKEGFKSYFLCIIVGILTTLLFW